MEGVGASVGVGEGWWGLMSNQAFLYIVGQERSMVFMKYTCTFTSVFMTESWLVLVKIQ